MNKKDWTGERLETFVSSEVAVEHLHRYALVFPLVKSKRVLDIASGEGYGSNLIADHASEVTGVDISADAISRAQSKYKKSNLKYLVGSAAAIPLADDFFDIVVSFETIEHHDQHQKMLSEIKRVLRPGGMLIMSSPDKLNYTDKRNFNNRYHVKELYLNEFKELIKSHFVNAVFYFQRATFASFLVPETGVKSFEQFRGNYDGIKQYNNFEQMYILSIASDGSLPEIGLSVFTDDELLARLHTESVDKVRTTASYKIGHYILWPFKAIKKLLSNS